MTASPEPTEQPSSLTTRPPSLTLWAVAVIALIAVGVRFYLMRTTHSTAEDFYITLRYAENVAHGKGMVYNLGERVLGTTTPFYTLFLALIAWLGMDPVFWGKAANILADGVSCWLLFRLGRAAGLPGAGLVAAALLALSPPNLTWSISGMETSLVTAAGLAVLVALAEKRPVALGIGSAVVVLLRIDGLLLVLVALAAWWIRERRFPARPTAVFLLLLFPWLLFATWYYGSPVPTSAIAKLTVYAWFAKSTFPNLQPFAYQMTHSLLHKVLVVGGLLGLWGAARQYKTLLPAAVWLVLYYAAMAFSKGFLFGWYYVPPSPVYFLLAAVGWLHLWGCVSVWGYRRRQPDKLPQPHTPTLPHFAAAALVLAFGLRALPSVKAQIAADQAVEDRLRRPIGEILRDWIMPGERLMLEPIGYIGYFSRARVLDAVGLVSPEVLPYFRRGVVSPYLDLMADLRPEWVLLRAGEYQSVSEATVPVDKRLETNYRLAFMFGLPKAGKGEPDFYLFRRKAAPETTKGGQS
jgi:hypothetical protein